MNKAAVTKFSDSTGAAECARQIITSTEQMSCRYNHQDHRLDRARALVLEAAARSTMGQGDGSIQG